VAPQAAGAQRAPSTPEAEVNKALGKLFGR
jgi:hypothetical protein